MDLRTEKEEGKLMKPKATVSWKKKKINAFEKSPERLEKEKMWKDTNYQFQQWGANTTDPAAPNRLRREPYKQLSTHKFECLDETNQFLKSYKLSDSPR